MEINTRFFIILKTRVKLEVLRIIKAPVRATGACGLLAFNSFNWYR